MSRRSILMMMVLGGWLFLAAQAADLFPDDHGDSVEEATVMVIPLTNGVTATGRIEMDTDQDWFHFIALPDMVYRLQAQVSSLWDMEMEFRGPHTTRLVRATSSALSGAPAKATVVWTNTGAAGPYFVGIRGYLTFTTGTYSFAVTPLDVIYEGIPKGVEDSDHDGLLDAWEWYWMGWTGYGPADDLDGDGADNLAEFYARTEPASSASSLQLHSRLSTPGESRLNWPAVPDSLYRVWRSTNLTIDSWVPLDLIYHPAGGGTNLQWNEALDVPQKYYKVQLIMDP